MQDRQKILAELAEAEGKTPEDKERELNETVYAELVSLTRAMKSVCESDYDGGCFLLHRLRRAEKDDDDAVAKNIAGVIIDGYFKERGDWSKIERSITDAAVKNDIDVASERVNALIKEATTAKYQQATKMVALWRSLRK